MSKHNDSLRVLELLLILVSLPLTMVLIALIALVVLLDTKKSPFFVQERLGLEKRLFNLYKFKTLKPNQMNPTSQTAITPDLLTTTGGFLRRTKLDELPQLLNVLQGHMSLVGPRPCLSQHIALVKAREASNIFSIRPGMTGLAQIHHVDMRNADLLVQYDRHLMKNYDFRLYFYCLWKTLSGNGFGDTIK